MDDLTVEPFLTCPFCQNLFAIPDYLLEHVMNQHFSYTPFHCCQIDCLAQFSTERFFKIHNRLKHNGVEQYVIIGNKRMDDLVDCLSILLIETKNLPQELPKKLSQFFDKIDQQSPPVDDQQLIAEELAAFRIDMEMETIADCTSASDEAVKEVVESLAFDRSNLTENEKLLKLKKISAKANRIQCRLCETHVSTRPQSKRLHSISHLRSESDIRWLFWCSMCSSNSMYEVYIRSHLVLSHGLQYSSLKSGVHYKNRTLSCMKTITRIHRAAFPDPSIAQHIMPGNKLILQEPKATLKRISILKSQKPGCCKRECKICGKFVTKFYRHSCTHLCEKYGIKWLFECLICVEYQTLLYCNLMNHMIRCHDFKSPIDVQAGVHYFNQTSKFADEISEIRSIAFPPADACRSTENNDNQECLMSDNRDEESLSKEAP